MLNIPASNAQLRASFVRWALFFVPLIVLLGVVSGELGSARTAWFQALAKPAAFPPPMWFGIAWSVLFVLIGISLALVASAWGERGRLAALGVFALHFIGTLAWTPVFFGQRQPMVALYVLVYVIVSLVLAMILFARIRRIAALVLLPYLAWVCFAAYLNYRFVVLNPGGGLSAESEAVMRFAL